ncbi:hypothetical protein ACJJTC_011780 [Scirpophaga incertulas]
MPRQKKGLTKEEKLAKDRERKREKYLEIKNNPELYAIQKEKERKRYLVRKTTKKICSIKEMTPRNQREQRKRWRRNSRKYLKKKEDQKKLVGILINNTPSDSETDLQIQNHNSNEPELDPLELIHEKIGSLRNKSEVRRRQHVKVSSIIRKMRYKHQKIVKTLQNQIEKLKKEKKMLKRKFSFEIKQKVTVQDSIEKKVNNIITDVRSERVEEVKQNLSFNEILMQDITEGYKTLKKKEKRDFANTVMKNKDRLKKFKVLNKIPFRLRKEIIQEKQNIIMKRIHDFFEEDSNSRVAAGKKECIKRKGIIKQKRYLTISLKNLHEKFVKEQCLVSYSTFCKYRPFWVVLPNNDRDTCMCKLHCNVDLLLKALKREKITTEASGLEMIKSICCDSKDKCLKRTCEVCRNKVLNFMEFHNDRTVSYYQWLQQKQKYTDRTGKENTKTVWTKKKINDYPRNIHNVQIEIVDEDEVAKERFPKNIPTFKGTMKVHQVVWSFSQPYIIALRALSCFACNDNFAPCSHGKHLGNSYFNALSNETAISNQLIDGRQEDNLLSDGLHIDSPTLACNIDDTNLQIDSPTLVHNMEELNTDIIPDSPMLVDNVTPKVKILSDIRINWQNLSFYIKPSQTFNPFDQSDFKKFIQERAEEASTFDVDCYASAHKCESSNKENYFGHPYDELIKNSDTVAVNNHKISLNKESTIMEIDEPQKEFITKNSHKYNLMDSDGKYNIDDWVIVEYKIKTKSIYFIGKIIAKIDNSEYKLHFLKKTQGAQSGIKFVWPINIDEDTIPEFQIVQQLEAPQENRRGQLFFKKLPSLNFK